jgi:hypothetical protein
MARGKTHGRFGEILVGAGPDLRRACESLRRRIASLHKGFVEVVWPRLGIASYGVGPRKMSEHYAYLGVHRSHVNLGFYHGAALADPEGLLEGGGRRLRHVKIRRVSDASKPAVVALLRRAIAERRSRAGDA